jgi:hypothetical protein
MAIRGDAAGDYLLRSSDMPTVEPMTACFWMYISTDTNALAVFFLVVNAGGTVYQGLRLNTDGTTLQVITNTNTGTGTNLSTGTWYHVAYTRSGSTHTVYLNGVSDASMSSTISLTPASIAIISNSANHLNGRVAHIKIWSGVALSAADIANEMYSIRPRYLANLHGWWPTFPGATERLADWSGNGRNWTGNGTLADEQEPGIPWGAEVLVCPFTSSGTTHQGEAALSGSGTIAADGDLAAAGEAALSGTGTIAADPDLAAAGEAALSGTGTQAAAGTVAFAGASALSGTGTLAAEAQVLKEGTAALEGTGTLAAAAIASFAGDAALSGAATIAPAPIASYAGESALSGVGTVAAAASLALPGASALSGTATLAAAGDVTKAGEAALSGTGTLAAAGIVSLAGATALSGTGTLAADPDLAAAGAVVLAGTATLAADGTVESSGVQHAGEAALSGSGTLAAAGILAASGASVLPGTGTVAAAGVVAFSGAAALAGTATVAAAAITNIGDTHLGVVSLYAEANIVAVGTVRPALEGLAILSCAATLAAVPRMAFAGAATAIGRGHLGAEGRIAPPIAPGTLRPSGSLEGERVYEPQRAREVRPRPLTNYPRPGERPGGTYRPKKVYED